MEAAGLSAPTVARKLCAVSSWYTWLRKHGHVTENPAEDLDRPYVDPDSSKTPGLTKDQALAMLAAADTAPWPQAPRNAALTALLLFTGARVSEAVRGDPGRPRDGPRPPGPLGDPQRRQEAAARTAAARPQPPRRLPSPGGTTSSTSPPSSGARAGTAR